MHGWNVLHCALQKRRFFSDSPELYCHVIDSYEKSEGNFMKYETISDMICRNMIIGFERKRNPVDMTKLAPPCEYEYATCCEIK